MEICESGMQLEHVSKFKYLGYVLDKSGRDEAESQRKGVNGGTIAAAFRSLVIVRGLQLECARVLH